MASSHPKASGSSPSLASAGTAILGGIQVSLTLLEKAMDGTNIPFVKGVAGAALEVIKIVKAIQTNREECTNLVERCTSLLVVILGSLTGKSEDAIPDYLQRGVERLTTNFQEVLVELKIIDKRSKKWRAVLYHLDNGDRLKGCSGKLQWAMEEFQVTAKVDSCLKDLERHEELRKGQEKIQESQQELQIGQVVIQDSQQELLKGQANIEENITKGQKEVRDGLSVIQKAMKEQASFLSLAFGCLLTYHLNRILAMHHLGSSKHFHLRLTLTQNVL
ncbi:hypothetical protein FRC03_007324 [Tulasnella sp. 419]|nr:hypothetical protein FRC03_007324 [Tulasnella sp. 419]